VPQIIDLVDPSLFQREPPRTIPRFFRLNLLGEYLLEQPIRTYLDVPVLAGLSALLGLIILDIGIWLPALVVMVLTLRLILAGWRLMSRVHHDTRMLRNGAILAVHVTALRHCPRGGAFIDCRLTISPRRQSVGSIYLSNLPAAHALAERKDLRAICLPQAPGVWRLLNADIDGLRYDRHQH
jgi:hypothetical protein